MAEYVKNKTLWVMEKMLITIIFSFIPECAIPFYDFYWGKKNDHLGKFNMEFAVITEMFKVLNILCLTLYHTILTFNYPREDTF